MNKRILGVFSILIAFVISVNTGPVLLALQNKTITGEYPYYAFVEDPENPWNSIWEPLDATDSYEYSDDYFAVESPGTQDRKSVV